MILKHTKNVLFSIYMECQWKFSEIINYQSFSHFELRTHISEKMSWIHADFFKSTKFLVLFRRDFPHHFSHIQAVANWNADSRQSYDPKTSGEGLVCWAEYSRSFLMIRKRTNHEMLRALSPGGRHKPQVLWGTQDRGSFTSRRSLVLLWDSGPHLGSSWTRGHPPTPRPSNFRGILGPWYRVFYVSWM